MEFLQPFTAFIDQESADGWRKVTEAITFTTPKPILQQRQGLGEKPLEKVVNGLKIFLFFLITLLYFYFTIFNFFHFSDTHFYGFGHFYE